MCSKAEAISVLYTDIRATLRISGFFPLAMRCSDSTAFVLDDNDVNMEVSTEQAADDSISR